MATRRPASPIAGAIAVVTVHQLLPCSDSWCHLLAACPIASLRWREMDSNHRFRDRPALSNTSKPYECMYFRDRHSGVRTWPIATGNRWFESISLQQRVRRNRRMRSPLTDVHHRCGG